MEEGFDIGDIFFEGLFGSLFGDGFQKTRSVFRECARQPLDTTLDFRVIGFVCFRDDVVDNIGGFEYKCICMFF